MSAGSPGAGASSALPWAASSALPWVLISAVAASALGCGENPVLEPIVDVPASDSAAYPYGDIPVFELSIARAGDDAALALTTARAGEPLALSDVPFGEDLVVHLSGTSDGVEIAYGRTCALDVGGEADLVAPHLYFSRIVHWGATVRAAPVAPDRVGGHAYALPDGRAVFTGGNRNVVEIFDPLGTGEFTILSQRTLLRQGSILVPFAGGRAILVGGVDEDGARISTVELLSPDSATAERQLDLYEGPALVGHAGVRLVDDTILVAGGEDAGGVVHGDAWLFSVGGGGILEPPITLSAGMKVPRTRHTMTRLGDELGAAVLILGGHDQAGAAVVTSELYRPLSESFDEGASLLVPRWGHAAVRMPGGFVLVLGGLQPDPEGGEPIPARTLELYDPVLGSFGDVGSLPAAVAVTEITATPLPDGRVLLVGGRDPDGEPVNTVHIARLDPLDGRVDIIPSDRLSVRRVGHSAVSLCDGTVLVVGGTDDQGAPAERYNPPSLDRR